MIFGIDYTPKDLTTCVFSAGASIINSLPPSAARLLSVRAGRSQAMSWRSCTLDGWRQKKTSTLPYRHTARCNRAIPPPPSSSFSWATDRFRLVCKKTIRILSPAESRGEQLAAHYASADIFLFPSHTETFGNVTLEAMASGLAVVAYDYAAAKMHITHNKTGVLVPYGDAQAFIQAAATIARAPQLESDTAPGPSVCGHPHLATHCGTV